MKESVEKKVAEHWNTIHKRKRVRWWHMPTIIREINRRVCGEPLDRISAGAIRLAQDIAGDRRFYRGVSVGGGSGSKEMMVLESGLVEHFTIYELSDQRIEAGQAAAEKRGLTSRIRFEKGNALKEVREKGCFDFVHWNNALHHMFNVRKAIAWSKHVLTDNGMFYMDDYVGPNRFQWSSTSLDIASGIRSRMAERYLRREGESEALVPMKIKRPSRLRIIREDPSEAPDSVRIVRQLEHQFRRPFLRRTGGLVYNLALVHTLHNFSEEAEEDRELLRSLMSLDDLVLAVPKVDNHYAVGIAWNDGSEPVVVPVQHKAADPGAGKAFHCVICGSDLEQFAPGGPSRRPGARCPECGSLERHRVAWLYLRDKGRWARRPEDALRFLHVAPEKPLARCFKNLPAVEYTSCDLEPGKADRVIDLTDMQVADESFDVIFCSHVLEHIPDDLSAMAELFRSLQAEGELYVQVPLSGEATYEDPAIDTPEGRRKAFGQEDHVRIYGKDIIDRLNSVGFSAEIIWPDRGIDKAERIRLGTGGRPLIVARKGSTGP